MKLSIAIVTASLALGLAAPAFAEGPNHAAHVRPALVEAHDAGAVARYIVGPLGHVRGFALTDGTIVFVHGQTGDAMAQKVAIGQTVRVDGRALANAPKVLHHAAVFGPDGSELIAPPVARTGSWKSGDPAARAEHEAKREARAKAWGEKLAKLPTTTVQGTVQAVVANGHGAPEMLLLSDGSSVFLERGLRRAAHARPIVAGEVVRATGRGATYPHGTSVAADELTFSDGSKLTPKADEPGKR